jgi:hypothetical protein
MTLAPTTPTSARSRIHELALQKKISFKVTEHFFWAGRMANKGLKTMVRRSAVRGFCLPYHPFDETPADT